MPTPIPSWLNPPDIAGSYEKGLSIGASIGQEQARLQAEHERTIMESQAREKATKQSALTAEARIKTESAYRTATLGLQQARLQDAAEVNAAKTKEAALKLADQQGFAADLKSGMKIEDALYRHPRLSTPASAVAAHKDTLDLGSQRLDLRQQQIDLQKQALSDREAKTPPPRRTGSRTTKDPETGNTSTTYTYEDRGVPAEQSSEVPVNTASPFKEGQVVKNKKNGKTYKIVNGQPVEVK